MLVQSWVGWLHVFSPAIREKGGEPNGELYLRGLLCFYTNHFGHDFSLFGRQKVIKTQEKRPPTVPGMRP